MIAWFGQQQECQNFILTGENKIFALLPKMIIPCKGVRGKKVTSPYNA